MRRSTNFWRSVATLVLLLPPVAGAAQTPGESDPRVAEARTRFNAGEAQFERRLYSAAAESFEACYEILRSVNYPTAYLALYNWARSLEEGGLPARAADVYQRYLDEGRAAVGDQLENAGEVEARIRDLRQRARLAAESSAEGGTSGSTGATGDDGMLVGAGIAYALAGAGAITMAIAGGLGLAQYDSLRSQCGEDGTCAEADVSEVRTLAALADTGLAVAAVGAAVGTTMLLIAIVSGSGAPTERREVSVAPLIGPSAVGGMPAGNF